MGGRTGRLARKENEIRAARHGRFYRCARARIWKRKKERRRDEREKTTIVRQSLRASGTRFLRKCRKRERTTVVPVFGRSSRSGTISRFNDFG